MDKIFFTIIAAFALATFRPTEIPKPTNTPTHPPEDVLLKSAFYDQSSFAIYEKGGEAMVRGKLHKIGGGGYLNAMFETEIVDEQTGDYIVIDTLGVTRYKFGNRSGVCLPALATGEKK